MPIIIAIAALLIDQLTKYIYVSVYNAPHVPIINGVLSLDYVENRGAAWGIFSGNQWLLYVFSALITIGLCIGFIKLYKKMPKLMRYALALIIAGAIGNMLDRFALHYVRDMIYFELIHFPVFNVADMCITIGSLLALFSVLFLDSEKKDESKDEVLPTEEENEAAKNEQ